MMEFIQISFTGRTPPLLFSGYEEHRQQRYDY